MDIESVLIKTLSRQFVRELSWDNAHWYRGKSRPARENTRTYILRSETAKQYRIALLNDISTGPCVLPYAQVFPIQAFPMSIPEGVHSSFVHLLFIDAICESPTDCVLVD